MGESFYSLEDVVDQLSGTASSDQAEDTKQPSTHKTEYGCVMLSFDFPQMSRLHALINADDIFTDPDDPTYGLETEPHCTLLYGLHPEVTLQQLEGVINEYEFKPINLKNISVFTNEKFDVLKFDVTPAYLTDINSELCEFPHTTSYPDYHPHVTIAYLKSGNGARYARLLSGAKATVVPTHVTYSQAGGAESIIEIKVIEG